MIGQALKQVLGSYQHQSSTLNLEKYQSDPASFFRDVLGIPTWPDPWPGPDAEYVWPHQVDIANAVAKAERWTDGTERTSVASCHAIGKDYISARIAIWFLACFRPSIVITTGPTDRQVKLLLWGEIKQALFRAEERRKMALGPKPGQSIWRLAEGHYAIGFKSKDADPERFQGFHAPHILYIVDEASGVDDRIYEGIEGGMSTGDARMLLIGNPTQSTGQFYSSHHDQRAAWNCIQVGYEDTPNFQEKTEDDEYVIKARYFIQPTWVANRRMVWGEDSALYQIRILGQFAEEGVDTWIPLTWVQESFGQHPGDMTLEEYEHSLRPLPYEIGVDIARYGDDSSVLHVRKGSKWIGSESWAKRDLMFSANRIRLRVAAMKMTWGTIRIDAVGMGAGVADRLREMQDLGELPRDIRITDVNVGEAAVDQESFNLKKDELYWGLRERFRQNNIHGLPDDPELVKELTGVRYSFNRRAQIVYESKEELKKRGFGSPDSAEALMLAFMGDQIEIPQTHEDVEMEFDGTDDGGHFGDVWHQSF